MVTVVTQGRRAMQQHLHALQQEKENIDTLSPKATTRSNTMSNSHRPTVDTLVSKNDGTFVSTVAAAAATTQPSATTTGTSGGNQVKEAVDVALNKRVAELGRLYYKRQKLSQYIKQLQVGAAGCENI